MENTWKWSIALLAMLLSMLAHVSSPCPASAQDEFRALKRGVVKIIAHKAQNVTDMGAGIIVGTDDNITLIVTAHHVIQDAQQIEVVFFDKQYVEFQGRPFRRYHEDLDIAVVNVESVEGRKVPLELPRFTLGDVAKLKEGAKVSAIGHPLDRDWQASIKTNTIAGLSDQEDFRKLRFTKTAMEQGNSGGPLFNDAGALIGMVTKLNPVHAVAVKIDALLAVLRDEWGMPTWRRAEEALAQQLTAQAVATRHQLADLDPDERDKNWGDLLMRKGRANLLQRSVLLAVEAMQRSSSPEAEQALRDGLAWLTRPAVRMAPKGGVDDVAFSPDSTYLATADYGKTVLLWEVSSGRVIVRLARDEGVGAPLAFSPDGTYLATVSSEYSRTARGYSGTVRLWEVSSGREIAQLPHDQEETVLALAFSPDGTYLNTISSKEGRRTARLWEVSSGREITRITHRWLEWVRTPKRQNYLPSSASRQAVAFSPDRKYIAAAVVEYVATRDEPNSISVEPNRGWAQVWEVSSGREVAHMPHGKEVLALAFSPDGTYLATASQDSTARLWEVSSGREVTRMTHNTRVNAIGFSPDGKYLATGIEDDTAWVWEVPSGREVARMTHVHLQTIVFSPDSTYLATRSRTDSTARVWEVSSGREMVRMTHKATVRIVAFSPDGKYLATGSDDGAALWRLWPEDLIAEACVRLTRNLTPEEWHQYVGDEPYHKSCANLP